MIISKAYETAKKMVKNGQKVPQEMVDSIVRDRQYSYWYAEFLIKNDKEVPANIIDMVRNEARCKFYFKIFQQLYKIKEIK